MLIHVWDNGLVGSVRQVVKANLAFPSTIDKLFNLERKPKKNMVSQKINEKKYGKRQFVQRIEPTEKPNKSIPNQVHKMALLTWQPLRKGTS